MAKDTKNNATYEECVSELEAIVAKLSEGSVPLEESMKLYTRGVELAAFCEKRLTDAEQHIKAINKETGIEEDILEERE